MLSPKSLRQHIGMMSQFPAFFNDTVAENFRVANAALGNFDNYEEFGAKAYTPWVATAMDLFAQDSWKVSSKLNIEFGLRWSLWPPWHSKWGNLAEFLPQFYTTQNSPIINPKTGYVVGGNPYDGIVFPGNGVPDAEGGGGEYPAALPAAHRRAAGLCPLRALPARRSQHRL